MRIVLLAVMLLSAACGLPNASEAQMGSDLQALLSVPKFEPDDMYVGVDAPEDEASLIQIVDGAVRDVIAMPEPRPEARVKQRLARVIDEVDEFASEDRERAYMYAVMIWRAAGFSHESGLLGIPDARVLGQR